MAFWNDKPVKILTHRVGSAGSYLLQFQVFDKDENPIPDIIIRIFDEDFPDGYFDLPPTDHYGVAICRFTTQAARKIVRIIALGSRLTASICITNK